MSRQSNRRDFLADVGRGMLVAGIGLGTAMDLGLTSASAMDDPKKKPESLDFGSMEPLVALMQETPGDQIVAKVIQRMRSGTDLKTLVAAAALANARTFGGEDYIGFHTMMALAPAFHMSGELTGDRAALPVLKVLRRNTGRIQEYGGRPKEVLHTVEPLCCLPDERSGGEALRDAVHKRDVDLAEATFALLSEGKPLDAFNELLIEVQDHADVHRVVMPYRAWDLLGVVGMENAHTMLRQSVRYCVKNEGHASANPDGKRMRALLPKLLDQYKLVGKPRGQRAAEDGWVDKMAKIIFEGSPETAADAAAAALAEGIVPEAVGEAIALAANQLVLRDAGRTKREVQPGKPEGSVHGDSIGVHACDSANAWRNMARVANDRNAYACLILGAYQVARDRVERGGDFLHWQPRPLHEQLEAIKSSDPSTLLADAESAIKANDQARACALIHRYGELGHGARPVFDLMIKFATSEDGALHAEKYYRTVSEEFASARPSFRWRQLVALARVTASEYGKTAPGYEEACRMLSV
ncbi:MAG: hypothetical protein JWN86_2915 [Planctomycetota bacterium]|nr:hypothetical protein [Planctomycetota bacterium]